ncbi:MAG: hypothetical protein R2734_17530 [Nocardioides sp.]
MTRATRQSSRDMLVALSERLPELVGGSADLAGSTGTDLGRSVTREDFSGSRIDFGIREFAMAAVLNGLSLHGELRPFGSTFLVFSDYSRAALRLAALMGQPVIHVFTHDSVAVGEDGPTHQPVEHVESLRLIPGLQVLRPADAAETAEAWRLALERTDGPTALVLTRQGVPSLEGTVAGPVRVVRKGDDLEIVASGSEVALAVTAAELLAERGSTRGSCRRWTGRRTARLRGCPRWPSKPVSRRGGVGWPTWSSGSTTSARPARRATCSPTSG